VTNKAITGRTLWFFMCGRGTHEKVYAELKNGFAFDCVPTQSYQANSAWQVLSILAFNLMRGLQASGGRATREQSQAAYDPALRDDSHAALSLAQPGWPDGPAQSSNDAGCR
jgi:hypothetical protein